MSFFSRIRDYFRRPQAKQIATRPLQNSQHMSIQGQPSSFASWPQIPLGLGNNSLTTNEIIFSVITRLANTLSSLPIHEYHNYDEQNDGLVKLFNAQANPSLTGFQLLNQMETTRNSTGNAFAWIERDEHTGTPIRLWPIDPSTVVVKRNVDDGSIWYDVNSSDPNIHFMVFSGDMIHVKHISPETQVLGISPIDVLNNALNFENAVKDFSLNEMKKKDQYIIKYDRSVSPEKRQAMINDFRQMVKENGGAVVQEKGFEYDRFQSNFQPADVSSAEDLTARRIANAFNIPLDFLNFGNTNNKTSNEQVMLQFVRMTLLPIVRQYESEFNTKLLTTQQVANGYYFKFNLNGLLRGDTAARTQMYQIMIRNGIATPNELRKLEDLPPVSDDYANKLWMSRDSTPMDTLGDQQKAALNNPPSANNQNNVASPENNPDEGNSAKGGETTNEERKEAEQIAKILKRQAGGQGHSGDRH